MSGHSKWSSIKHKKALVDSKRGKLFTKLIREITISARESGADSDANPKLRLAVAQAKQQNMGQDTIQRAINKGLGSKDDQALERITYEGYGPFGAALIVETLTDNRNRTASSIRHLFSKFNGNLGSTNSVLHLFAYKGVFVIEAAAVDEDQLTELALEAGADDLKSEPDQHVLFCPFEAFENVRQALETAQILIQHSELTWLPQAPLSLSEEQSQQLARFLEALENDDDVQQVFSNCLLTEHLLDNAS